jgi:hypothetical protein
MKLFGSTHQGILASCCGNEPWLVAYGLPHYECMGCGVKMSANRSMDRAVLHYWGGELEPNVSRSITVPEDNVTDDKHTMVHGGQGGLLRQIADHLRQADTINRAELVLWCKTQAVLLDQESVLLDHYSDRWAKEEREAWDRFAASWPCRCITGVKDVHKLAARWADKMLAERGVRFAP